MKHRSSTPIIASIHTYIRQASGWLYLVPIIGIAIYTRLIYLTKADIWHDEGYTAMLIKQPLADIISIATTDVHPPLYYILMHMWYVLFGDTVTALRGFSVVCGIATIILLFFLTQKLFSKKIAVVGAFFAAIGPFLVRYSDEARMYALAALIGVAATYVFVKAVASTSTGGKRWWLVYGALMAAGMYTQYFLALLLPAHFIYLWLSLGGTKPALIKLTRHSGVWISAITCFLLFLPWLPVMILQTTNIGGGFWIPPIDHYSIANTLSMYLSYSYHLTDYLNVALPLIFIITSYAIGKTFPAIRAAVWLLTFWIFIPMIVVALLSLRQPIYLDRYFTYSAPAFYVLLSVIVCTIDAAKARWRRVLAAALTLCLSICMYYVGLANIAAAAWNQTSLTMSHINRHKRPGDQIVSTEVYTYFNTSYYNTTTQPLTLLSPEGDAGWGEWGLIRKLNVPQVPSFSAIPPGRIWLITRTKYHEDFMKQLPNTWRLQQAFFDGDLIVGLYDIQNI